MNPPKIFISATSDDLSSARQIAKEALLTINCHPVEQTNFEPDWRSVTDMLRGKIGDCQALIHLVGFRYGAEPDPASLPDGTPRRSYTQMEYHLARELGLRVYTFLLPETYPFDVPAKADTTEQTQLQAAHRTFIQSSPQIYDDRPTNDLDLRTRIIALQEQVISLVREQQSIAKEVKSSGRRGILATIIILLVLGVIGLGVHQLIQHQTFLQAEFEIAKHTERVLAAYQERFDQFRLTHQDQSNDIIDKMVRDTLPVFLQLPSSTITRILDYEAGKLAARNDTRIDLKLKALFVLREYEKILKLGDSRNDELNSGAFMTMGHAAYALFDIKPKPHLLIDSLRYYTAASAALDKDRDPLKFAATQEWVALLYHQLGKDGHAEPLMREVYELRKKHSTSDNIELIRAMGNYGMTLLSINKKDEAEKILKEALNASENKGGKPLEYYPIALTNLGGLLGETGRAEEAAKSFQQALDHEKAILHPSDPGLAIRYNNLALSLINTPRHAEVLPLLDMALKIDSEYFGTHHPNVATRKNNIAYFIDTSDPGKAEELFKSALEIDKASLGLNHPMVARDLNNLAMLYVSTKRAPMAIQLIEEALGIEIDVHGSNHSLVALRRSTYGRVLKAVGRKKEAEDQMLMALKIYNAISKANSIEAAGVLNNLAWLLMTPARIEEAQKCINSALSIDRQILGNEHPDVARDLNTLATVLYKRGAVPKAGIAMEEAVRILFQFHGKSGVRHENALMICVNYIDLSRSIAGDKEIHDHLEKMRQQLGVKADEFEALWQEALKITPAQSR